MYMYLKKILNVISETYRDFIEINEDTGQVSILKPLRNFAQTTIHLIIAVRFLKKYIYLSIYFIHFTVGEKTFWFFCCCQYWAGPL